jgi:hypothetical protein
MHIGILWGNLQKEITSKTYAQTGYYYVLILKEQAGRTCTGFSSLSQQ